MATQLTHALFIVKGKRTKAKRTKRIVITLVFVYDVTNKALYYVVNENNGSCTYKFDSKISMTSTNMPLGLSEKTTPKVH